MKKISAAAIAVFALLATTASPAVRRRAIRPPVSDDTPAGWLLNHAYPYVEAIGPLAGSATVVGLGDDTHGTHEFFDVKLRMIQELVRNGDFRIVGFEGPFPDFNKLDDYVLGGSADPRAILRHHELGYWFWASEEVIAVIDWIRQYNAARGDRPAVEIVGFDVTDAQGAADMVTSYLDAVDPAASATARTAYAGCYNFYPPHGCASRVAGVLGDLDTRQAELVAKSSQRAFDIAEHAAHIAAVGFGETPATDPGYYAWRDENMAANALHLRKNRKMILWAHHEHIGRTTTIESVKSMGKWMNEQLGANYFAVGTCTGAGSFNVVVTPPYLMTSVVDFPSMSADSYEWSFQSAGMALMLIPLKGPPPDWLSTPHELRGGTSGAPYDKTEVLPQKFDAILYIDHTTPSANFW